MLRNASEIIKLIKENTLPVYIHEALKISSIDELKQLAEAMVYSESSAIYRRHFVDFISEQALKKIQDKIKKKPVSLDWCDRPKSEEGRIRSKKAKLKIEDYIEEARPFIQFINSHSRKNLAKANYEHQKQQHAKISLWNSLSENFSKLPLSILETTTEIGKLVFAHTIGLKLLHDYTSKKFYHLSFASFNIPTVMVNREYGISRGNQHFILNPVNMFIFPFQFLARNIGKLVGFTLGLLPTILMSPILFVQSVRQTINNNIDNTKRIKDDLNIYLKRVGKYIDHLPNIINNENADNLYDIYYDLFSQHPEHIEKMLASLESKAKLFNKIYYIIGKLYQDLDMQDKACENFSQLDNTHPKYIEVMFECGNYAYANNDYVAAEKHFQNAVSTDTEDKDQLSIKADCQTLLRAASHAKVGKTFTLGEVAKEYNPITPYKSPAITIKHETSTQTSFIKDNIGLIIAGAATIALLAVVGVFTFGAVPLIAAGITGGFAAGGIVLSSVAATTISMGAIALGSFFAGTLLISGIIKLAQKCFPNSKKTIAPAEKKPIEDSKIEREIDEDERILKRESSVPTKSIEPSTPKKASSPTRLTDVPGTVFYREPTTIIEPGDTLVTETSPLLRPGITASND